MTADAEPTTDETAHREVVHATGHENVRGEHASTFEVTTDDWLTPAGDCILAVDADRSPADFTDAFRTAASDPDATIRCTITVDDHDQDSTRSTSEDDGTDGTDDATSSEDDGTDDATSSEDDGTDDATSSEDDGTDDATSSDSASTDTPSVTITGRGHADLAFADDRSLVGRTSTYVDDRTVLVDADAAAVDVDRELVDALADGADVRVVLEVDP